MDTTSAIQGENQTATALEAVARQAMAAIEAARKKSPPRLRLIFRRGATDHADMVRLMTKSSMPFANLKAMLDFDNDPSVAVLLIDESVSHEYLLDRVGPMLIGVEAA